MADRELERPLSPELVLVSPDLRERALLDEPDVPLPPEADFDPPQAYVAPPTASVPPAPPVEVPSPPPVPPPAQAAGPIARRLTAGTATAIALAALIVFGAGLAIGKFAFPTSTARSPAALRSAAPQAPVTVPVPRTSSSASKTVPAQPSKSSAAPPRAEKPSRTLRPIPNGGYIFSDGTLRISGTGRRILSFTLRTRCSGSVTLPPIEVAASGTFAYSGQPAGALPGTTVHVTGRFVSPVAARGTTRVTRGTCHDPARPFAARLS